MKSMKILLIITVLTFQIGCSSDNADHLRIKYHLLKFNHSVDQILDIAGTPDIKLPEVIGESWIWRDESGNKIIAYISPRVKWTVPATDYSPRVTLDTGRLIYKQWLETGVTI